MVAIPDRAWQAHHEFEGDITFGLISDTHIPEARRELYDEAYDALQHVDVILHSGDMHDIVVLDWLQERCGVPVLGVCGNGDDGSSGRTVAPDDERLPYNQVIDVRSGDATIRIGMTHDFPDRPLRGAATLEQRMQRHFGGPVQVVVAGDTHVPLVKSWQGTLIVNSGSPTYPRNLNTQLGTVAFLEIRGGTVEAWIEQLH